MTTAYILTAWTGIGTYDDPPRPQLLDDHPSVSKYEDVTGQDAKNITPDPNLFVGRFEMNSATLAKIEADGRYYVLEVEE